MTTNYLLPAVVGLLVLYIVFDKIKAAWKAFKQKQASDKQAAEETIKAQTQACLKLTGALEASAANSADANKLLAGTLKACESIAQATIELKASISSFEKLVSSPKEPDYPKDNISAPASDKEAEVTAMSFEKILRGMPVQQAVAEAEEEIQKKTMISAADLGEE